MINQTTNTPQATMPSLPQVKFNPHKFHAIVLGAGFGKRLSPLTDTHPKVTLPIFCKPLIANTIEQLLNVGFTQIHVNTHYLHHMVETEIMCYLKAQNFPENTVRFWHEPEILETGGGIKSIVQGLFQESPTEIKEYVFVVSGDIYAPIPFIEMSTCWNQHKHSTEIQALMCGFKPQTMRNDVMWVDAQKNEVVEFGVGGSNSKSEIIPALFSNHQIIKTQYILGTPQVMGSSVHMFYKPMLKQKLKIKYVDYPSIVDWHNVGTFEEYSACLELLAQKNTSEEFRGVERKCLFIEADHHDDTLGHLSFFMKPVSLRCLNAFQEPHSSFVLPSTQTKVFDTCQSIVNSLKPLATHSHLQSQKLNNIYISPSALFFLTTSASVQRYQHSHHTPVALIPWELVEHFSAFGNFTKLSATTETLYKRSKLILVHSISSV
jgi:NDP-sugar pyrophosphorylase family protein